MDFNQIKYFLAIVRNRNFSVAADELFISQSSISKKIKALEDELGALLFIRNTRDKLLTPAGECFLRFASDVNNKEKELFLQLEKYKKDSSNTLRIGSIPIISSYGVLEKFAAFKNSHSQSLINFDINETNQYDVLKELRNGNIDLALLRIDSMAGKNEFETLLYSIEELVLICDKSHLLANKVITGLDDIVQYPIYLLGKKSTLHYVVTNLFKKKHLTFISSGDASRHKVILELLNNSQNVTVLPAKLFDPATWPNLRVVHLQKPVYSRVALVRLKNRKYNKLTNEFWKFWKKECTITDKRKTD